jgi:CheY-like chemotaxis protein
MKKILIVEDDQSLIQIYQAKLEQKGYQIEVARDGQECLDKVYNFKPDVILLDIILPKVDGFTVLDTLGKDERTKNIPVILTTNLAQDEDVQKGKSLGAIDYLTKVDFTPTQIVEKIEAILSKRFGN